jgi:hypothetical protein
VIPVQQIREVQMSAVDSVHLIRRVAASPEQVFAAWTNAALLQRWLAPKAEADARLGGRFRLEVAKPEGSHIVTGEYRELAERASRTRKRVRGLELGPSDDSVVENRKSTTCSSPNRCALRFFLLPADSSTGERCSLKT